MPNKSKSAKTWLLLLLAGGALVWPTTLGNAGVSCSLPFNLQNNTVADANQVMANYNALVTCLTQAAHAGANSDITSLSALSSPIPPSSGGTFTFIGTNSVGANTITTTTTPTGFALTAGYRVGFVAGSTNTTAATLNVNSTGVKNVFRRTLAGASTTVGGEIVAGNYVELVYDGTQYQIMGPTENVGMVIDWAGAAGATPPPGWAFADGTCAVRATYAALFAITGTTYDPTGSTCGGTEFALPDLRGRITLAKDNQGGATAGRVTNAETGCTATNLGGAGCGQQSATLTQANLPNVTITTDVFDTALVNCCTAGAGTNSAVRADAGRTSVASSSLNGGVTPTTHPLLPPTLVVYKIIKY